MTGSLVSSIGLLKMRWAFLKARLAVLAPLKARWAPLNAQWASLKAHPTLGPWSCTLSTLEAAVKDDSATLNKTFGKFKAESRAADTKHTSVVKTLIMTAAVATAQAAIGHRQPAATAVWLSLFVASRGNSSMNYGTRVLHRRDHVAVVFCMVYTSGVHVICRNDVQRVHYRGGRHQSQRIIRCLANVCACVCVCVTVYTLRQTICSVRARGSAH